MHNDKIRVSIFQVLHEFWDCGKRGICGTGFGSSVPLGWIELGT